MVALKKFLRLKDGIRNQNTKYTRQNTDRSQPQESGKSLLSYEATNVGGHCWPPPCTVPRQALSHNVCTTIWVPLQLSHFSRTVEIPLSHITTVKQKADNKLNATDRDEVKIRALISKSSLNQWTWN